MQHEANSFKNNIDYMDIKKASMMNFIYAKIFSKNLKKILLTCSFKFFCLEDFKMSFKYVARKRLPFGYCSKRGHLACRGSALCRSLKCNCGCR